MLLCILRFSNSDLFDSLNSKALFEHLPEPLRYFWNNNMTTPEEAMDIGEMTVKETTQARMIGDSLERIEIVEKIAKFSCT